MMNKKENTTQKGNQATVKQRQAYVPYRTAICKIEVYPIFKHTHLSCAGYMLFM